MTRFFPIRVLSLMLISCLIAFFAISTVEGNENPAETASLLVKMKKNVLADDVIADNGGVLLSFYSKT